MVMQSSHLTLSQALAHGPASSMPQHVCIHVCMRACAVTACTSAQDPRPLALSRHWQVGALAHSSRPSCLPTSPKRSEATRIQYPVSSQAYAAD
jgi:hypothetical protein